MIDGTLSGFGHFTRGFGLIWKPGIRPYVIIPLIINILVFSLMIWHGSEYLSQWVNSLLPTWLNWEWLRSLIWWLFTISLLFVSSYLFVIVANLISAPFNGLLAEQVEFHLTGQKPPSSDQSFMTLLIGSISGELKKLAYTLVRLIPVLILFVIPGLNLIAPIVWILFSAWMLAIEYADYPMGNHDIHFPEQRKRLEKNRMMALSFGGGSLLFTTIPLINLIAMPVSVAGATSLWVARLKQSQ